MLRARLQGMVSRGKCPYIAGMLPRHLCRWESHWGSTDQNLHSLSEGLLNAQQQLLVHVIYPAFLVSAERMGMGTGEEATMDAVMLRSTCTVMEVAPQRAVAPLIQTTVPPATTVLPATIVVLLGGAKFSPDTRRNIIAKQLCDSNF